MSNAIVTVNYHLNLPPGKVGAILGGVTDYRRSCDLIEQWVKDHPQEALEYVQSDPDVEADL